MKRMSEEKKHTRAQNGNDLQEVAEGGQPRPVLPMFVRVIFIPRRYLMWTSANCGPRGGKNGITYERE